MQIMKVIRSADRPQREVERPLFTGIVTMQAAVDEDEGAQFNIGYVSFPEGVRSKLHRHTTDQVLIVTKGRGMVATEHEQVAISEGDIVHTPAGEQHWHGAVAGSAMTHIAITPAGSDGAAGALRLTR
jgi:quercetin dioxygenase-like cupin family protein